MILNQVPFGSYMVIRGNPTEGAVTRAKEYLYRERYLSTKALLKHFAGVDLSPVEWIVKPGEKLFGEKLFGKQCVAWTPTTIGWKAYSDGPVSKCATRRMFLAGKRAEHAKPAIRRSFRKDWDDD